MKIGLIGFGFINKAVAYAFGKNHEILYWCLEESNCTKDEMFAKSDAIFVSVPTPMKNRDGNIDLSIIKKVFDEIADKKYKGVVILKSTVVPGTTKQLLKSHPKLRIVFNPEFLRGRSANSDFIKATRIILGGRLKDLALVKKLYRSRFKQTPIFLTDSTTAEFIKYMSNMFLVTKVIYMNVLYKAAKKIGVDWDMAIKGLLSDSRVGKSHYQVPGHDGDFGFGGYCFPKDINAFIHWLKRNKLKDEAGFFELVWKLNLKYRKNRDWENINGAMSKK